LISDRARASRQDQVQTLTFLVQKIDQYAKRVLQLRISHFIFLCKREGNNQYEVKMLK